MVEVEEYRGKKLKVSLKINESHIIAFLLVCFPIANSLGGYFSYYDELLSVIGLIIVSVLFVRKKLDSTCSIIYVILLMITGIGLISNWSSHLTNVNKAIMLDILALWKIYMIFMLFVFLSRNGKTKRVMYKLQKISKFMVVLLAALSIAEQFIGIGMDATSDSSTTVKFGFIWNNAIQTGWLLFACLIIIAVTAEMKKKEVYKYIAIAAIPMVLTKSSLVWCWLFVVLFLTITLKDNNKFKLRYIILLTSGVLAFSISDFYAYADSESVRMKFLTYAVKTANTYFPLGSGFATYGTDMAAKYYSPLYSKYGWENTWAMGRDSVYLNDTFFAGILGQFGWFGLGLYLIILILLFHSFNTVKLNKTERAMCLATVITVAFVMVGSASAKSMMGAFMFAVLGLMYSKKGKIRIRKNENINFKNSIK